MSSCIYHKNQDKCSITRIPNVILLCASLTPDNQSCVDFQNFVTSEVLYKWNCTICNILWLNYFSAQQNSLKVHLNCWVSIKSSFCVIAKQYTVIFNLFQCLSIYIYCHLWLKISVTELAHTWRNLLFSPLWLTALAPDSGNEKFLLEP